MVEPRRREILRLVRDGELPAGAIAAHFPDVSRPTISQHLRVLRTAGLIAERREGTRRLYRTAPGGLDDVRTFLDEFWDSRLELLKAETESEQQRGDRGRR